MHQQIGLSLTDGEFGVGWYYATMVRANLSLMSLILLTPLIGTVITIHEDPTRERVGARFDDEKDPTRVKDDSIMYSHFMDVFAQLANPERDVTTQNPMTILPIRKGRNFDDSALATWPSLLFYYLFDDWFTGYSLVARKNHQYGVRLDRLVRTPSSFVVRDLF
jgi:hypothetical protein